MIRLVVFDVDGTLMSHKAGYIPKSAIESIRKLKENGMMIAIASERPYYEMDLIHDNGIPYDYLIGCNGQLIYDAKGNVLSRSTFELSQVEKMTAFAKEHNYPLYFKFTDGYRIYCNRPGVEAMYRKYNLGWDHLLNDDSGTFHLTELPVGGVVLGDPDVLRTYQDDNVVLPEFGRGECDVSLSDVNKGWGLEVLCKHLGISLEEVMAFGDGDNDVEMLDIAGIGVAMKECSPRCLEVCDAQTSDILEDGIQHALQLYHLLDEYV